MCDQCRGKDTYEIYCVVVSNFNTPENFAPPKSGTAKYDHLGLQTEPFEVRPGGYAQVFDSSTGWHQLDRCARTARASRPWDPRAQARRMSALSDLYSVRGELQRAPAECSTMRRLSEKLGIGYAALINQFYRGKASGIPSFNELQRRAIVASARTMPCEQPDPANDFASEEPTNPGIEPIDVELAERARSMDESRARASNPARAATALGECQPELGDDDRCSRRQK